MAFGISGRQETRVFEQKLMTPEEEMQEIKAELQCRNFASGRPDLSSFNV